MKWDGNLIARDNLTVTTQHDSHGFYSTLESDSTSLKPFPKNHQATALGL